MARVWFIRHTESESNANLRTTHPAQSALTPKGLVQAEAVAMSFKAKPSLIVVSPYIRARQTALPTIARFQPVSQEEWPVFEFTYLDPVRYLNTTADERIPFSAVYWERNDPDYKDGGKGESFAELMGRVRLTTSRLRQHDAPFIAMFSHGLFLRAVLWSLLTGIDEATPETMRQYYHFGWSFSVPNGAILKSEFREDDSVSLGRFETSHLTVD